MAWPHINLLLPHDFSPTMGAERPPLREIETRPVSFRPRLGASHTLVGPNRVEHTPGLGILLDL